MRFVGIDVGGEKHAVAAVDQDGTVVLKPTPFPEDAAGYAQLRALLGAAAGTLVVVEATGHYWQNLVAFLLGEGFAVALVNPLRTRRFAEEDLQRAKTDTIDALGLARFGAQKRPAPSRLPDAATQELRELVRLRERLQQELGDRVRQLHRVVDLGFPEFTRHVRTLDSALATTLLAAYPTAVAFTGVRPGELAALRYDGRHTVGRALATPLLAAAAVSVGRHHGAPYQRQVRYLCEDIAVLRRRLRDLEGDIARTLETHEVGKLLTTITGIGTHTAARLVAEADPTRFRDGDALAAFVGAVPGTSQSGKRQPQRAGLTLFGHRRLRRALWMPTLSAVRRNPWLRAFYEGLRARGKLPKVALVAAMRKLLHAVYSVAKHRRPFVPRLPAPELSAQ